MTDENFESLQAGSLHELAKICWGDFVLKLPERYLDHRDWPDILLGYMYEEKEKIVAHRKSVINRISETPAYTLPKILKEEFVVAVIRLQRGYHEALICAEKLRILNMQVNPLTRGPYSAKNFINPTGHFNELAWAKSFVSDANQSAFCRFELACNYCFEEVIRHLWYSTIRKERHPYEGGFENICEKSSYFVAVWVCWLENKFDQVVQVETDFADGFYVGGFRKAMDQNNEFASRFFWARCSDTEKLTLNREINEHVKFEGLSYTAFRGYAGCVNFIYSLLSFEEKRDLISYKIEEADYNIWSCLLLSPFYQSVLNDIKTIPFPSNDSYEEILFKLISTMLQLPIPEYKEIFKNLWNPLSQNRQEIIGKNLICLLTRLNDIDLLDTVFRPFSRSVKEHMLLNHYDYRWRKSSLNDFYKPGDYDVGDYDAMLRYLLLFLVDRDPVTQRSSVRDDATDLLYRFTTGDSFLKWINSIPESAKRGVRNVVESVRGSLYVLHTLLDRVEEMQFDIDN